MTDQIDSTNDSVLLEDEFLEAAIELQSITATQKALTKRADECKEILAKVLAVGDRGVSPDNVPLVKVNAGSARFSATRAIENLPAEQLAAISVTAPDGKKAKATLAPALYELCVDYTKPSIQAIA